MAPSIGANFETGKRVNFEDFLTHPTGAAIISRLQFHQLEDLFCFDLDEYSYDWAKEFYEQAEVKNGQIFSTIKNYGVQLTPERLGAQLNLKTDGAGKSTFSNSVLLRTYRNWKNDPAAELHFNCLRKDFPLSVYVISDLVGSILLCKSGNKDRFTEEQLRLTMMILSGEKINWAQVVFDQLCTAIKEFQGAKTKKYRFVRLICHLWRKMSDLKPTRQDSIKHTKNKDFSAKSITDAAMLLGDWQAKEGSVAIPDPLMSRGPAQGIVIREGGDAQPSQIPSEEGAAVAGGTRKRKGKGKLVEAKKQKPVSDYAETDTEALKLVMESIKEEKRTSKSAGVGSGSGSAVVEVQKPLKTKAIRLSKEALDRQLKVSGSAEPKEITEEMRFMLPPMETHFTFTDQPSASTPASSLHRSQPIPAGQLLFKPSEAQTSLELKQDFESIYNNRAATWISPLTNPYPDVVRPIYHLPDYIRNLLAFLYEGRNDPHYQQLYLNQSGEMVDRIRVEGGNPDWDSSEVLSRFGKYLWGESPAWNCGFALSGWLRQEEIVADLINKWCKKNNFRLEPSDPFLTGVRIQDFDPERHYGAVFSSNLEEKVQFLSLSELKDTSREALQNLLPEADDKELENLLKEIDTYKGSPARTASLGSPPHDASAHDPSALLTYRRRQLRERTVSPQIQDVLEGYSSSSSGISVTKLEGEEVQKEEKEVQTGVDMMDVDVAMVAEEKDEWMNMQEGVVEDAATTSDDDTALISTLLPRASAPEASRPGTSAPVQTPLPKQPIHSPPSSPEQPSPKRQKSSHPSLSTKSSPPSPRQRSVILLSIPPNTEFVSVDPVTGDTTFFTKHGQIIPNLSRISSVDIPSIPPALIQPSSQMTVAFPNLPFLTSLPTFLNAVTNSLSLAYIFSRGFQLFLLVQLYMSHRRPLALQGPPAAFGPVLIEDLSSDSEDLMEVDDVDVIPQEEEEEVEFIAMEEDEVAVGAGALGIQMTPTAEDASASRHVVVEQLVDTGIFQKIEDLEFRRTAKEDRLEECVNRTGNVLGNMLNMLDFATGQVINSTCTQEFNTADTALKIDAAVETITRTIPHLVENAVQRVLADHAGAATRDSALAQAAELENLRARLVVAEELAVNAMKEEKRKAALLSHVLKENQLLREVLGNREQIPSLPPVLNREALASLALQQDSWRIKKAKKLAKRSYRLKLLSEISSDSSAEESEDLEAYISEDEEPDKYSLDFQALLKKYRKKNKKLSEADPDMLEEMIKGRTDEQIRRIATGEGSSRHTAKGKGKMYPEDDAPEDSDASEDSAVPKDPHPEDLPPSDSPQH